MSRPLIVDFVKMHGAENDFIIVDNRFFRFSDAELSILAAEWCPRRTGIGADGLLALAPPESEEHDYRMRYFNADGSRATMCGNGARCLARFARDAGLDANPLTFESDAGVYRAEVIEGPDPRIRLYVPPPEDYAAHVALKHDDHEPAAIDYVWTGTEHAVCFVDDLPATPVEEQGQVIRHDDAFAPTGANANFVEVLAGGRAETGDTARLAVRTYEKGVEAETRACGTGALAAAVVARKQSRVNTDRIAVEMPGGTLIAGVQWEGDRIGSLYLEGPATYVFRGTVEVQPKDLQQRAQQQKADEE
jgi:diaminopimelate epimerase